MSQDRPQKEGEAQPSLIIDLRDSYQPSKPIDKPNLEDPTKIQYALTQITEGRIYKALIKVKIRNYILRQFD